MKEPARYRQLANYYRRKIQIGELNPGDRLPSQTELAHLHDISVVTVRHALALLVEEGLVSRRRRRGTYVKDVETDANCRSNARRGGRVYFLFDDLAVQELYSGVQGLMMRGVSEECENQGLDLRVHDCHDDYHIPGSQEDGYLVWGYSLKLMEAAQEWSEQGYRLIALHNHFPHIAIPHINADNFAGGYLATHHLLSLGHRRIGVILPNRHDEIEMDVEMSFRLAGYRSALKNFGIPADNQLLRVMDGDSETEFDSEQTMQKFMTLEEPPTAVFAVTDLAAVSAMTVAQRLGYDVPEDVSIVGYDGLPLGEHTIPKITTVDQGFYNIGANGVRALQDTHTNPTESVIKPSLILRESTAVVGTKHLNSQSCIMDVGSL